MNETETVTETLTKPSSEETRLTPLLVTRDARRAIDFYVRAFGARIVSCFEHGPERIVGHADLVVGKSPVALTEELPALSSHAPPSLGGTPVVLQLHVAEAQATLDAALSAGGRVLQPLGEWLGERMARLVDPFGHVWLLRQTQRSLPLEELQRQRDALYHQMARALRGPGPTSAFNLLESPGREQAEELPTASRGVHLVLGPVGAGKSTYARSLAAERGAVRLTLDDWMARLFRPDRPKEGWLEWYATRAARCVEQIWSVAREVVDRGGEVVLELGLVRQGQRLEFYEQVERAQCELTLHVLDAPREVRRRRVARRNEEQGPTYHAQVPLDIFELASDAWEPVSAQEQLGRQARFVATDTGR